MVMGKITDLVAGSFDAQNRRIAGLKCKLIGLVDLIDSLPCECGVLPIKCKNCQLKDGAVKIMAIDSVGEEK